MALIEYITDAAGHVIPATAETLFAEVDEVPADIGSGAYKLEGRKLVKDTTVLTKVAAVEAALAADADLPTAVAKVNGIIAKLKTAGLMANS